MIKSKTGRTCYPSFVEVDLGEWNTLSKCASIESWLAEEGVYDLAVTVPYRQNR